MLNFSCLRKPLKKAAGSGNHYTAVLVRSGMTSYCSIVCCESSPQFPADLVTFTEEILNGKLHFFVQCLIGRSLSRRRKHGLAVRLIFGDPSVENQWRGEKNEIICVYV